MTLEDEAVLLTGANRGIGQALVYAPALNAALEQHLAVNLFGSYGMTPVET